MIVYDGASETVDTILNVLLRLYTYSNVKRNTPHHIREHGDTAGGLSKRQQDRHTYLVS